ncbi:MAG: type VI secretion system baseplate subunit TssK, partial [Pseudomonadota bacterium]
DALPEALDVPDGIANSTVLLSLPIRRPGALEIDASGSGESAARFTASEVEITDTMGSDRRPVTLAVGRMQLALALDVDDLADRLTIPIARIIEKQPDGAVVIDKAFLPSCLDLRASPTLHGFVNELVGILTARLDALAGRLSEGGAKAGAEITDFLLLMTVNRALPRLRHLHGIETVHPVALYQDLVGLAGELATYVAPEKRPPEFPPYRHDDLTATFQPVMRVLRQYLSAEIGRRATLIALEPRKYGISTGIVPDRRLVSTATFVLAAKADVEAENMRRHFP